MEQRQRQSGNRNPQPKTTGTRKGAAFQGGNVMTSKKEFEFTDKKGAAKVNVSEPEAGNKASEIVMAVLNKGPLPSGLKLQMATSYGARFINRRGKNALGWSDTKGLLVVNGIADELKEAGQEGLIQPQKGKRYWAIRVNGWDSEKMEKFISRASRILGFPSKGAEKPHPEIAGKAKKRAAKKEVVEAEAVTA